MSLSKLSFSCNPWYAGDRFQVIVYIITVRICFVILTTIVVLHYQKVIDILLFTPDHGVINLKLCLYRYFQLHS